MGKNWGQIIYFVVALDVLGVLPGTCSICFAAEIYAKISPASSANDIRPDWSGDVYDIFYVGTPHNEKEKTKNTNDHEIQDGDAERLIAIYKKKPEYINTRLHLINLVGGNIQEGIKIGKWVWKNNITTSVDADRYCFSACAFIFMAGRNLEYEAANTEISRFMHVSAAIGFHAPYYDPDYEKLPSCSNFESCRELYARAIREAVERYRSAMLDISGILLSTSGSNWPPSLVGELLKQGKDEVVKIDTVDDAGRWDIGLFGNKSIELNEDGAKTACLNVYRWSNIDHYLEIPSSSMTRQFVASRATLSKDKKTINPGGGLPSEEVIIYSVTVEEMNALGCEITVANKNTTMQLNGNEIYFSHWMTMPPSTKLNKLPN